MKRCTSCKSRLAEFLEIAQPYIRVTCDRCLIKNNPWFRLHVVLRNVSEWREHASTRQWFSTFINQQVETLVGAARHRNSAHTYFLLSDDGLIKIGKTKRLEKRIKALQVGSGGRLRVLLTIPQDREMELHARFAGSHVHGEWFKPNQDMWDFINGLED